MEIDLRQTQALQRLERLVTAFEGLPGGRGMTFVSEDGEATFLAHLQAHHQGEFEWYPLEAGPIEWRVVVGKRPAGLPRHRYVLEFMESDHHRINQILGRLATAAAAGRRPEVAACCAHLRTGLMKHFRAEEELLFPIIATYTGGRGPATVLVKEHNIAARLLDELQSGASGESVVSEGELLQLSERLRLLLTRHVTLEERVLYTITDLLLDERERDQLIQRCQRS